MTYDITRLDTFNNLATWYNEVMAQSEPDVILFLVGNKKDEEKKRAVTLDRVEKFKNDRGIQFSFETSAMTGENIEQLFITASKVLYNTFKDKIDAMVSNDLLIGRGKKRSKKRKTRRSLVKRLRARMNKWLKRKRAALVDVFTYFAIIILIQYICLDSFFLVSHFDD